MKHLIIGTAGHVDHGKTALIKALTDIDCDTHKEEKNRGITINLGFSHISLSSGDTFGIVDVPGHKDFIKTMVAGAYGIDIVLLVVAADSGIMPQTEEHLKIIEMLGIQHGIIVLNKIDLVDEEMQELAELEIAEFLEGTMLENAPVVGVSALSGNGIDQLVAEIEKLVPEVQEKESAGQFRMYIDRIFNVKGIGYVVTGSVLEGELETGRDIFLLPGKGKKVKVRNIERHGKSEEKVYCGDRAALNLAGLKLEDYERGMVLSDKPLEETSMIDATVSLFESNNSIGLWTKVVFFTGTFECAARMHLLDKDVLEPGDQAIVQIHLEKPAVVLNRDKFIIRNSSNDLTLGGGTIVDVKPLHHKKRTPKLLESLNDLVEATIHRDKLFNLIKIEIKKENVPVFAQDIATKLTKSEEEVIHECRNNGDSSVQLMKIIDRHILVSTEAHQNYISVVLDSIQQFHKRNRILEEGLEPKEFYGKLGFGKNDTGKLYLDALMKTLKEDGKLKNVGTSWAMVDHKVTIDPKTQEQLDWLEGVYKNVGMDKPYEDDIAKLAQSRKISKDEMKMMLKYLFRQNKMYYYEGEYIHHTIVDQCRKLLLSELIKKENGINEKEFRFLIDGTKRFVQLMIGLLSQEGVIQKQSFFILITEKGKAKMNP